MRQLGVGMKVEFKKIYDPILFPCVLNNIFYDVSQVLNMFPITSHF